MRDNVIHGTKPAIGKLYLIAKLELSPLLSQLGLVLLRNILLY